MLWRVKWLTLPQGLSSRSPCDLLFRVAMAAEHAVAAFQSISDRPCAVVVVIPQILAAGLVSNVFVHLPNPGVCTAHQQAQQKPQHLKSVISS